MIIRANGKEISVKSVVSDSLKNGLKIYPALRFEFENEVASQDVEALASGSFEILDDDGNVLGTHEGYTTLKSVSVIVGKITTAEQQIEELEAENAELQAAVDVMVGGNA